MAVPSQWLLEQGYSRQLVRKYVQSNWLVPLGRGVYARPEVSARWQGLVLGMQYVAKLPFHVGVAWLIMKYSTRLPLRQFFAVSGGFIFILAVVFAGKGISALQEAGKILLDPVVLPSIDLLGVYPNYQGLSAQGLMIILACIMIIRDNRKQAKLKV